MTLVSRHSWRAAISTAPRAKARLFEVIGNFLQLDWSAAWRESRRIGAAFVRHDGGRWR
jgi:hypothetical protein